MSIYQLAADEVTKRPFFNGETPHLASGISFTIVFSIFTICNAFSCIYYHQWWFLGSWGGGLVLEIVGYSGRIWYSINDTNGNAYIMELVCVTVAPCFLMAGIYNIFAQLVIIYGTEFSILKPKQYSLIFIICDVLSVFIQGAGGGLSSHQSSDKGSAKLGSNLMIAGMAFQVVTMTIFQFFWCSFLFKIIRERSQSGDSSFNPRFTHIRSRNLLDYFFVAISVSVILIFVRSIYRLIEMSEGWSSQLAKKEIYFNILEGLMISLAGLIMCIFSPGLIYGKYAHLKIGNSNENDDYDAKNKMMDIEFDSDVQSFYRRDNL